MDDTSEKKLTTSKPIINPNRPRIEENTSMTRILTNRAACMENLREPGSTD